MESTFTITNYHSMGRRIDSGCVQSACAFWQMVSLKSFLPDSRRIPNWRKTHRVAPAVPARRTSRHRTKTLKTSVNMLLRGQCCFDTGGTRMDPITTHLEFQNFLFPLRNKDMFHGEVTRRRSVSELSSSSSSCKDSTMDIGFSTEQAKKKKKQEDLNYTHYVQNLRK